MDPNACLNACRRIMKRVISEAEERQRNHAQSTYDTQSEELALNFKYLDEWLTSGGFLPSDWNQKL